MVGCDCCKALDHHMHGNLRSPKQHICRDTAHPQPIPRDFRSVTPQHKLGGSVVEGLSLQVSRITDWESGRPPGRAGVSPAQIESLTLLNRGRDARSPNVGTVPALFHNVGTVPALFQNLLVYLTQSTLSSQSNPKKRTFAHFADLA